MDSWATTVRLISTSADPYRAQQVVAVLKTEPRISSAASVKLDGRENSAVSTFPSAVQALVLTMDCVLTLVSSISTHANVRLGGLVTTVTQTSTNATALHAHSRWIVSTALTPGTVQSVHSR